MKKILLLLILVIISIIGIAFNLLQKKIAKDTQTSPNYFSKLIIDTVSRPTINHDFNFVILGLDKRNDWLEKTSTTDTIIFSNLNFSQNQLNLISLPRDLWSYSLQKKINEIYPLSEKENQKYNYIQNNFSHITGQNIDKTVVLTTDNLIKLITIINGVDVYLEKGFEDKQYPNPEYINNPSPQTPVYITINFSAGWNHLDSSNITQFVRSRKNADTATEGGTDLGRIQRQELVINALFQKMSTIKLADYSLLVSLYNFWHYDLKTNFSDADLLSILLLEKNKIFSLKINKIDLPTGENPQTDIIYHPKSFINKQWVFLPQDKNYESLHQFITKSINQ